MELKHEKNQDFLRKLKGDKEARYEKLAEVLNSFVTDCFHEYQELLQEELHKEFLQLQDETKERMAGFPDYGELKGDILSHKLENFVNERIRAEISAFEEKKLLCADMIYRLIPDSYEEYQPVWEAFVNDRFRIDKAVVLEIPWMQELEDIQETKAKIKEAIVQAETEGQETEAGFHELMRQNAAKRSELEKEKPEIQYTTKVIRREGFLGFIVDLFGKKQTETIADDSELCEWQKKVQEIQEGYDAQAREWNERLESIKERQKEKEAEYSRLDERQRELEVKTRTLLEDKVQKELEHYLHGEDGLSVQMIAALERDMGQCVEEIGRLAGKACRGWNLG